MSDLQVRTGQRGSALIWVITLFFMFTMAALVVDISRLYFIQQQMQSVANTAATAAAENTHTCGSVGNTTSVEDGAITGALAAGWDEVGTVSAEHGLTERNDSGRWEFSPAVTVEQSNSVGVRYQRTVPMSLLLGSRSNIDLEARAVARKEVTVGLTAQASAASLDSSESELLSLVIGGIFEMDGGLALSNIGFSALGGLFVDAEDLVAELAGGISVEEIASTDVTALAVMEALSTVANLGGPAGAVLDDLVAAAGAGTNLSLETIITAAGAGSIPPGAQVPVLAVVTSTVLSVGQALPDVIRIDVGGTGLLSGFTNDPIISVELTIDEAPPIVFAPARHDVTDEWIGTVRSADITVNLTADVDVNIPLLARIVVSLPLEARVGSGDIRLVGASCASSSFAIDHNQVSFDIDAIVSALTLETAAEILATGPLGITLLSTTINSSSSGTESMDNWLVDAMSLNDPLDSRSEQLGSTDDVLANTTSGLLNNIEAELSLLGISVGLMDGIVSGVLAPLIIELSSLLLDPLLSALGLSSGRVDVTVFSPDQSTVALITNVDF